MNTLVLGTGLLAVALAAPAAQAAEFTVQALVPPGFILSCRAYALASDESTSAAGGCSKNRVPVRPYRFSQGAVEDLSVGSGLADPVGVAHVISPDGTRTAGWMSERYESVRRLFVRDAAGVHLYDVPGGTNDWGVKGINDRGQVVGYVLEPHSTGFVMENGVFTIVQESNSLLGINNQGLAVGYGYSPVNRRSGGLFWHNGASQLVKGGKGMWFSAVDSHGAATGTYFPGRKQMPTRHGARAVVYRNGQLIDLDPSSTTRCSVGMSIGGAGQVVGRMHTCGHGKTDRPFFHDGVDMLALDSLVTASDHAMWTVTQALAINESGVILATATRDEGGRHPKEHPVLLRPVTTR